MNPEYWQKIERIFSATAGLTPEERRAYLDEACEGDEALKSQIVSLLELEPQAEGFIEAPAFELAAREFAASNAKIRKGDTIGNYKILSRLGEGGMGEVFLAEDTTLKRRVALKMLAPQLIADEQSRKRLLREASLGSSLDHPNICTIHEISESGGNCYIAMQFVEGRTLSELIDKRPLELDTLYSIALQIADALRTAHEKGIIHRDIKSNNVIIDPGGRAKVLDFGLAKLLLEDESPAETQLTLTGAIKGTPAYMSPEQASGGHVGFRSDIFSFGVVLYEMSTGVVPFKKKTRAETMAAIINEPHEPSIVRNPKIPGQLSELNDKLLAKDPKDRIGSMEEVLGMLRSAAAAGGSITSGEVPDGLIVPYRAPKLRIIRDGKRWFRKHKIAVGAAAALLLILVSVWFYVKQRPGAATAESISVAVIPFVNENGDDEVEYLSDGMTESMINSLSRHQELSVRPRSSVFTYKGLMVPVRKIASQLSVNTVLSGRMVQRGENVTVYLSIVDARANNQVWGKRYDSMISRVAALQGEMESDVARALGIKQDETEKAVRAVRTPASPDAYQFFLKGRFHANKRSPNDLRKAVDYFEQAVAADPEYALAYAALSDAYNLLAAFGAAEPIETAPKVKKAAERALELEPDLADAHIAMGHLAEYFEYDYAKAEAEFRRAIELDPNSAIAREYFGTLLSNRGRHAEAEREFRKALELEPLSLGTNRMFGEMLFFARRYEESIVQLKKTIELDENFASTHRSLARVYQATGNHEGHVFEYARYQELIGENENAKLLRSGFRDDGWEGFLKAVTEAKGRDYILAYNVVPYYASLGDKDRAFAELNKVYEKRYYYVAWVKADPLLDPLRGDPRFSAFLERVEKGRGTK